MHLIPIISHVHLLLYIISTLNVKQFSHQKENTKLLTNFHDHTLSGIIVGWSDVANDLLVYNPITKELYTTSIYKIDGYNSTNISLIKDGGMPSGLYFIDTQQNTSE